MAPGSFSKGIPGSQNSLEKRFDSQSRFMHPGFCKHRQGRICGNRILSKQRSMASPHRTNLLLAVVINIMNHVYRGILCWYISNMFYHNLSDSICNKHHKWYISKKEDLRQYLHTLRENNGINECQKKTTFPKLKVGGIESFPLLKNQTFRKHLVHL